MTVEPKKIHTLKGEPLKTPHSLFGHMVYLSIHPGRLILLPFKHWFDKHYSGKYKFDRAVFSFDLALIGSVISLFLIALFLILVPPKQFRDDISFRATVAPHEVVSGASSTLVITYQNNTNEPLRNPKLTLLFPKHFLLQSVSSDETNTKTQNISLRDIPVNGTGAVHVQGVMFGDVGGEQTFGSTLSFTHGKETDIQDQKTVYYTFSPTRSTLSLDLTLPEQNISSQTMTGTITYKNTGLIDYKKIQIKPEWPDGFTFKDASVQMQNGSFVVSNIKAGSSGSVHFTGKLGAVPDQLSFRFLPSFTFETDQYKQEVLTKNVPILPAQIQLTQFVETNILTPGTDATFHIIYKHVGKEVLRNVDITFTSRDPFIAKQTHRVLNVDTLNPGDEGDLAFQIPIRDSVASSLLTSYENIHVRTNAVARYSLNRLPNEQLTTSGDELRTPLTTPLNIESFARYTSPGNDQIGRGPLPPRVGQKTSYWIFWNVDGTTNPLQNAIMEGTLPANVSFSGNTTASEDEGVTFDPVTRKITWDIAQIPPTLNPESKVYSVAFEVILTPKTEQIGSPALLLQNTHFQGKDAITGVTQNVSKPNVTTSLQSDTMAKNKAIVR